MKLGSTTSEIDREENNDIMPFGKHKGDKLTELDTNYISFLLTKCEWIDERFRDKLSSILSQRKRELPCFGELYDYQSRTCGACAFMEECAEEYHLFS